jgi:hypothetical protein
MDAVEFELYRYMVGRLPCGKEFIQLITRVLMGQNVCEFKYFKMKLNATRMSGEMCTSLGNGFSNKMFMEFMLQVVNDFKLKDDVDTKGVVEGDDGLFATKAKHLPTTKDFERLGLKIKLEEHTELTNTSFCGIIFDPEECINVTDPIETLLSYGWTNQTYKNSSTKTASDLLRAKSLSYAYQYPGCPIIGSMAWYGLRVTQNFKKLGKLLNSKSLNTWDRDQLLEALKNQHRCKYVSPGMRTRLLIEERYGVKVEHQQMIEDYFLNKNDTEPISLPILELYFKKDWVDYYNSYVVTQQSELDYPDIAFPSAKDFKCEWSTSGRQVELASLEYL